MQILGNTLDAKTVKRLLRSAERKITELESELAQLPAGNRRARAFLHKELSDAYTIAAELRVYEPEEHPDLGLLGSTGRRGGGLLGGMQS